MILTDSVESAAEISVLLARRSDLADDIKLHNARLQNAIQDCGAIEDELERMGVLVERITQAQGTKG